MDYQDYPQPQTTLQFENRAAPKSNWISERGPPERLESSPRPLVWTPGSILNPHIPIICQIQKMRAHTLDLTLAPQKYPNSRLIRAASYRICPLGAKVSGVMCFSCIQKLPKGLRRFSRSTVQGSGFNPRPGRISVMRMCAYVYAYARVCVYIYMYLCICASTCVCVYVYKCVCKYVYK